MCGIFSGYPIFASRSFAAAFVASRTSGTALASLAISFMRASIRGRSSSWNGTGGLKS